MSFLDLPNEVIQRVFQNLPVEAILACQQCCKRLNALSQLTLLWKPICIDMFRYWHPDHSREKLLATPANELDWRNLIGERHSQNEEIRKIVDDVAHHLSGRRLKISRLVRYREDAKDVLRSYFTLPQDRDDGMAQTYWAREALANIDRSLALDIWQKLYDGQDVSLEHAFAALDLMVAQPAPLSPQEVSTHLDELAAQFREGHSMIKHTPRILARALAEWLLDREYLGLTGNGDEHPFHRLKNSLIGVALTHEAHPSIPIVSVVIYSCIARRLGLDAHPCAFPDHVLALVRAPSGQDLDGNVLQSTIDLEEFGSRTTMYLDPFNSCEEIPVRRLKDLLSIWGVSKQTSNELLGPALTKNLIRRSAANLRACLETWSEFEDFELPFGRDTCFKCTISPQCASYAASWSELLFSSNQANRPGFLHQPLTTLLSDFEAFFKQDTDLLSKHIIPLFNNGPEREYLTYYIQRVLEDDTATLNVHRREDSARDKVKYKIGQIFRHVRYGYGAVIYAWDTRCEADDNWIARMRVDALPGGRDQCFYHVIDDTGNPRYVAEENVDLVHPTHTSEVPEHFMRTGGQWFKRYDVALGQFVSNMKEQYPDD